MSDIRDAEGELQESLDELTELADDLVDNLADSTDPDEAAEELACDAEDDTDVAPRGVPDSVSMRETLDELERIGDPDPPARMSVEISWGNDKGRDLDAHLNSLFGNDSDERKIEEVAASATVPDVEEVEVEDAQDAVEAAQDADVVATTAPPAIVDEEPESEPDTKLWQDRDAVEAEVSAAMETTTAPPSTTSSPEIAFGLAACTRAPESMDEPPLLTPEPRKRSKAWLALTSVLVLGAALGVWLTFAPEKSAAKVGESTVAEVRESITSRPAPPPPAKPAPVPPPKADAKPTVPPVSVASAAPRPEPAPARQGPATPPSKPVAAPPAAAVKPPAVKTMPAKPTPPPAAARALPPENDKPPVKTESPSPVPEPPRTVAPAGFASFGRAQEPEVAEPPASAGSLADTKVVDTEPANPAPLVASRVEPVVEEPRPAEPTIVAPVPVDPIQPAYPERARQRGERGTVVLNVLVNERGQVVRVVVDQGIPGSSLEAAAIDAVLRRTYHPATENGTPVRAWATETFKFGS